MTVSDILDGGFAIMKRAPATVIGLTAVFVVPVQALGAWLNRGAEGLDLGEAFSQSDTSFQLSDSGAVSGAAWAVLQVGPMIALVFVAAAMARLVSAWHVGHDLTLRELLRGSVTRAWPLLAAWTMVHLLELVSVLGPRHPSARRHDLVPRHRARSSAPRGSGPSTPCAARPAS